MLRFLAFFVLAALWFAPPDGHARQPLQNSTQAQPAEGPVETLRTTTRSVVLDVVVTDHDGRPVPGLTKSDFTLREDGKPQQIASFNAVSSGKGEAAAAPHTILVLDELNTEFTDLAYARYSVSRLLKRGAAQLAQPTELYALTNTGLITLSPFTRDPAVLQAALDRHKSTLSWRLNRGVYAALEQISISIVALRTIAAANVGVPGHKNVVWISPGFPIFGSLELDARSHAKLFDSIRSLSSQMLAARISVYSIDPRGVFSTGGPVAPREVRGAPPLGMSLAQFNDEQFAAYVNALSNSHEASFSDIAVQTLAQQTGGRAIFERNDVDEQLATMLADGNTFYTLSYSPTNHDFNGKFRKISVTLSRPGVQARTRDGYYALAEGAQPSTAELTQEIADALTSSLNYVGLPNITTYTQFSKSPDRVKVSLIVATTSLSWSPGPDGRPICEAMVGVMNNPESWDVKHAVGQRIAVELPADMKEPAPGRSVAFTFELPVRYPVRHMRIVIRDAGTGRMGSVDIRGIEEPSGPAPFTKLQKR